MRLLACITRRPCLLNSANAGQGMTRLDMRLNPLVIPAVKPLVLEVIQTALGSLQA